MATYLQAGVYFVEPISGSPIITVDDAEYEIPSGYAFYNLCKKNI